MTGFWDIPRCEDCGIPIDRHGEDCGYYADEEYGNPEYGRPAGWLNPGTGEFMPIGPAGPGPRSPSPWGGPEPPQADDPDEPTTRDLEPDPPGWHDVPDPEEGQ
jgi:hypothetical protein